MAAPAFHVVDIDGDEGNADYGTASKWIWESLQTIESFHLLQSTLGDVVEHSVETMQRQLFASLHDDHVLQQHPLVILCNEAFAKKTSSSHPTAGHFSDSQEAAAMGLAGEGLAYTAPHLCHKTLGTALELMTYRQFYNSFESLTRALTHGEMYSACESRWKVLRCRYRLHRAFNADYEDHHNVVLGGGDVTHAAKQDIRRIGTCVSSSTLVKYMRDTIGKLQNASSGLVDAAAGSLAPSAPPSASDAELLQSVEHYFGPNRPESERLLSAEGLSLFPNFSQVSDQRLDVFEKNNPTRPRGDHALLLLKHFLKFQHGDPLGVHLANVIIPTLSSPSTLKANEFLELELTVHGLREGEVMFLASWCERYNLYQYEPKIRVVLRVVLMERVPGKHNDDSTSFAQVLDRIFSPLWAGLMHPAEHRTIATFLTILNGISVAVDDANETQALPPPATRQPSGYDLVGRDGLPPDPYFFYFVWKHTQLLNLGALSHLLKHGVAPTPTTAPMMDRTLQFRIHSDNKLRSFSHCVSALMLADTIVNPTRITQWSPLGYLFYLTQRHVVVTPSANNASNARFTSGKSSMVSLIETGMNVSIASMDPLHHHATDNALQEELFLLHKVYHLHPADLTELCLRSIENANLSGREIRTVYPNSIRWMPLTSSGVELSTFSTNSGNDRSATTTDLTAVGRRIGQRVLECVRRLDHYAYRQHRKSHCVPSLYNRFPETQCPSVRLAFRELCHAHEIRLLGRVLSNMSSTIPRTLLPADLLNLTVSKRSMASSRAESHVGFPRLNVRGPHVPKPSTVAKRLVDAFSRREGYRRFSIGGPEAAASHAMASANPFMSVLHRFPPQSAATTGGMRFEMRAGVVRLINDDALQASTPDVTTSEFPTWKDYVQDYKELRRLAHDTEAVIFCKRRLATLEHKFLLHRALVESMEERTSSTTASHAAAAASPGGLLPADGERDVMLSTNAAGKDAANHCDEVVLARRGTLPVNVGAHEFSDFYRCIKVDVHCHMASGMTGKQLLEFMQLKAREAPDDIVGVDSRTGCPQTLIETLQRTTRARFGPASSVSDLTVSALDVQASSSTFNRFDHFNNKYNPLGVSELRSLFLKTENFMGGRYFAEIIKQTFDRQQHRSGGNVFSEFRLSIYGRSRDEWHNLAHWWAAHGMQSRANRWMIQVPRIFQVYKKSGIVHSFAQLLENVFLPLWEVTLNPSKDPILARFLENISGFDSVDNESGAERDPTTMEAMSPEEWTISENPPFSFWMYHMWSNIASINQQRRRMGQSVFSFRPHCGESGDPDHLIDAYFLADGIGHGVQLKRRSVLQYLFYFAQIGLGMTPLSNNALFCKYHENPFPLFFHRGGLHVALSTDGPLQFHHTGDPLIEEYATAAKFWNLSTVDACEIASNSVRMSGFGDAIKRQWLGQLYMLRSTVGNEPSRSRVPHTRVAFRYEVYDNECRYLEQRAALVLPHRAMVPPTLEDLITIEAVGLTRAQVIELRMKGQQLVVGAPAGRNVRDAEGVSATSSKL
jgi:AMP deaminase